MSTLCTVEVVVVVQCMEVGEERNILAVEALSCNILALVGEVEIDTENLVEAVKNLVVAVNN